jgi:hypothetical protein
MNSAQVRRQVASIGLVKVMHLACRFFSLRHFSPFNMSLSPKVWITLIDVQSIPLILSVTDLNDMAENNGKCEATDTL